MRNEVQKLVRQIPYREWQYIERDGKHIIINDHGHLVCEKPIVEIERYQDALAFRYIEEMCPSRNAPVNGK